MSCLELCVGAPGTGKTHTALADAAALGQPVFVVDSNGVDLPTNISGARLYPSRKAAFEAYGAGESVRYIPKNVADFDALGAGFYHGRNAVVVVDELVNWTSAQVCPDSWLELTRLHRHVFCSIFLTTQQPQDVPAKIRNCITRAKIFRCSDPNALDAISHWADVAAVAALPDKQFLEWTASRTVEV